jgi:quercetin 2,3-dioxygenase
MRPVLHLIPARQKPLGPGQFVFSPLPNERMDQFSPFLMLDHFGPQEVSSTKPFQVPPHPHKGFEPVTLLFRGEVLHRDSLGNTGHLNAGDVQWMTAGSGIIHAEGIPPAFLEQGGEVELIQLWVNLSAQHKAHAPRYQDLRAEQFPLVRAGDAHLRLIAGSYEGESSPTALLTPVLVMHGRIDRGGHARIQIPQGYNAMVYVLSGKLISGGKAAGERNLFCYAQDGAYIELEASEHATFVVLAGQPIAEPVASYGPFVMNTRDELIQAVEEYQSGKMGVLDL